MSTIVLPDGRRIVEVTHTNLNDDEKRLIHLASIRNPSTGERSAEVVINLPKDSDDYDEINRKIYYAERGLEYKKGLTLPFSKYIGPGNSLNQGKPSNNIDIHAREHDIAYNKAIDKVDIYNADKTFLSKISDHLVEYINGNEDPIKGAQSIVSGIGIGGKHLFEKSINKTIYPSFPGKPY